MSEQATTPDLVELVRTAWDVAGERSCLRRCPPERTPRKQQLETSEAFVYELTEDLVVRITNYSDIDAARAAVERLANERE